MMRFGDRLKRVARLPWLWFVLAGYLLRIILMPVTGQHDVMFMAWQTHFINQGHLNLYAFLHERFGDLVTRPAIWAPYPYGFYVMTTSWLGLLERIGAIDLSTWESTYQVAHLARHVFLFKLLYLIFDLIIGSILHRASGRTGLMLWAWSPLAIYTPFMMGQNDIYATTFMVLGVYASARSIEQAQSHNSRFLDKWSILSSIFLGIGSVFKIFPLLLLPPMTLITAKNWGQRLLLICLGFSIFGLAAAPFIKTPMYINGVLFNPEGAMILRETQFFGITASPFLLGYVLLLVFLSAQDSQPGNPISAWSLALIVMGLLFLWIPSPIYWLIWITPVMIGGITRLPKLLFAHIGVQLAFAIILLTQHRELGVALPIHLEPTFNVPNLANTLTLTHPILARIFLPLVTLGHNLLMAALLFGLWYAFHGLIHQSESSDFGFDRIPVIGMPMLAMLLGLITNLFLARDLVSTNNSYLWENMALSSKDFIVQALPPGQTGITGIRLRFADAPHDAVLKVCLYKNGNLAQPPQICQSLGASRFVESNFLYFIFDQIQVIAPTESPVATIHLETPNAIVTLPYAKTNTAQNLRLNDSTSAGTLDISTLSRFDPGIALQNLVIKNIFQDSWLWLSMVFASGCVFFFLTILCTTSEHPSNHKAREHA